MERYRGTAIAGKIAIGTIYFYKTDQSRSSREQGADAAEEMARFDVACEAAQGELDVLCEETAERVGTEEAAIFQAHRMLLADPSFRDFVCDVIRERAVRAEYAVTEAREHFMRMLADTGDALIADRAADVADVAGYLLRLLGEDAEDEGPAEPSILAAEDLPPAALMRMKRSGILALVVRCGSPVSHTAILARAMGLPALFGVDVREDWDGRMAVVDGTAGEVILDPDEACLKRMRDRQANAVACEHRGGESQPHNEEAGDMSCDGEFEVSEGRRVRLYANITGISEADAAVKSGAAGIGLFRSEFLYLAGDDWPTEEEQFAAYRAVAEVMGGKPVIIRTLDAGADKQAAYMGLAETPGDGRIRPGDAGTAPYAYRGVRVCLDRPEMFRTQLRAILRAAAYGTVSVMFPMITSIDEVRACKAQLETAREEAGDHLCGSVAAGIMIETPEAVACSERLAREVDFFSIGTNDLAQYLLGMDRREAAAGLSDGILHPALAEALSETITNGHAAGIPVGICGELAADPALTRTLLHMGADVLSVAPEALAKVREEMKGL